MRDLLGRSHNICESSEIKMETRKAPTLVELCIKAVIKNVRYLGDVGDVESEFLEQILPHCTVNQLMRIENSTKGRDLSPLTAKLWEKFFEEKFGPVADDEVIQQMKEKKVSDKWTELYRERLKIQEARDRNLGDWVKGLYAQKQSRKIQVCNKVTPWSTYMNCLMDKNRQKRKPRKQNLNCLEAKNTRAMKVKMKKPTEVIIIDP